jgi:UDP-N-acetylmuramate dehydrogenase
MNFKKNISLKKFNSFGIGVSCDYFIEINNEDELFELSSNEFFKSNKHFILGAGTNVLFIEDFKGIIVYINILGKKIVEINEDFVILNVKAGENWNDFVKFCVNNGYYGLENLALIPGKIGAAPVQNIGAYGVEQEECFISLTGLDLHDMKFKNLTKKECRFGYRDSIFKREFKNIFIITSVNYKLSLKNNFNITYKELELELNKLGTNDFSLEQVYDSVSNIRNRKLPDPKIKGNAGSFFKNPIINSNEYKNIKEGIEKIPFIRLDDEKIKIPAAWLIEKSGWKGYSNDIVSVYAKHSLILVNEGKAKGKDILNLADKIKESVYKTFNINLEMEVELV